MLSAQIRILPRNDNPLSNSGWGGREGETSIIDNDARDTRESFVSVQIYTARLREAER